MVLQDRTKAEVAVPLALNVRKKRSMIEGLDPATLHCLVQYDRDSGEFTWLKRLELNRFDKTWNTRYSGKRAGWFCKANGYIHIDLEHGGQRGRYTAHRLAWLYVYGELPALQIDHVNRIRTDNRIVNLRLANQSQQNHNMTRRLDNTTGMTGVSWAEREKRWIARITVDGAHHLLGYFKTFEEAAAARMAAAQAHVGEFSSQTVNLER